MEELKRAMALLSLITVELGGLTAGGAYLGVWLCEKLAWPQVAAVGFALLGFSLGIFLVSKTAMRNK